ncbi:MAG: acetyl-CoA C-acyltransferase [Ignavibacteria bacterium CG_4_8_14_3_um_filter_37_9]|nr:thiolase family protein [Ignavibacteria bacterium]OIO14946.1 MAG: acetyl-CoA acetyltransferase [Ignavibacteria bacterium CG1_02_37_35]PIS43860.1 MAG: acetyl-CoA C-acyltransferase [Ignavibacteria bacterium CG08_land_8_20_14_0_20_37_9]PIW98729.1 MAG: acetyl-CoA C-acyltransferase [Ignavibacteria bacterium CG_4_8_14_3_um_filter_37_9]PIX95125.1 MAG: acetyl-CoA C-acyltransferase [Ignavibacteria bacterium CG_4_10_14_3_um_filter_37_18]
MKKVVITHAKRTAVGTLNGSLSGFTAPQLGSFVIKVLLSESGIDKKLIDEVIMGNVLTAGLGQAPARQAAIYAGLSDKTECLTINKMCGSGLKAVMLAQQAIACGDAEIIIAGGQESMTNAPYLLKQGRNGYRLGNSTIYDSILIDGLVDVYNNIHMGNCAESCAKDFHFTREELDAFAVQSYKKALAAIEEGKFTDEIVDVILKSKTGEIIFNKDEEPGKVNFDKISSLRPVFDKNGVVTAANASSLNDGAAALLIMSEEKAKELGLTPLVEIVAQSSAAKAPIEFTTAPADAIQKVLTKAKLTKDQIDLFEINEAFAVVSLAVNKILGLPNEKINVNGGATAIGHPIGASGARILTTLLYEMKRRKSEYGLATLCIGGGEASALIVKKYS